MNAANGRVSQHIPSDASRDNSCRTGQYACVRQQVLDGTWATINLWVEPTVQPGHQSHQPGNPSEVIHLGRPFCAVCTVQTYCAVLCREDRSERVKRAESKISSVTLRSVLRCHMALAGIETAIPSYRPSALCRRYPISRPDEASRSCPNGRSVRNVKAIMPPGEARKLPKVASVGGEGAKSGAASTDNWPIATPPLALRLTHYLHHSPATGFCRGGQAQLEPQFPHFPERTQTGQAQTSYQASPSLGQPPL